MNRLTSLIFFFLFALVIIGCERKPEDLEVWRTSEGGFEKLEEWAASNDEPIPVRVRAIEMLIEEGRINEMQPLFESIKTPETQQKLIAGVMPSIEAMWAEQDMPKLTEDVKKEGGRVAIGDSKSVKAKDAAFFLHPYAGPAEKAKFEAIMAEWMSSEQDLRTKLGSTTVGQLVPRAGKDGLKSMMTWLEGTKKPATVQRGILEHSDTPEVKGALATILAKRAEAEHPKLSDELEVAILENAHENLAPYMEKAIKDPETPNKVKDGFMDALAKAKGDKATPFFAELVRTQTGLLRWVAAQRLVEIRGKAGILAAANAFPLDGYGDEDWKVESEILCNFISTEMPELGIDSIEAELKRGLASDRWPAKVLSLQCIRITKSSALKDAVLELSKDKSLISKWGEEKKFTVGALATETAEAL